MLLPCGASHNARRAVCNRIFAFAASIFQIFGVENAAIFRAKFADRARSALCTPTNHMWRRRVSSSRRALCFKSCENILKQTSAFAASVFQIVGACGLLFLSLPSLPRLGPPCRQNSFAGGGGRGGTADPRENLLVTRQLDFEKNLESSGWDANS